MTNLSPHNFSLKVKDASKGSDFVGLAIKRDKDKNLEAWATFPMGYGSEAKTHESVSPELRSEILLLVRTISGCKRLEGECVSQINSEKSKQNFPIASIIYLIEDFLDRGSYYTEKEKIAGRGLPGKISWSATIKRIKPIVSETGIAFLDFIVRKTRIKQDQLITELHKYCVRRAFEYLGFLYTSAMPEEGLLTGDDIGKDGAYYSAFLEEKIAETHLEANAELFSQMKNLIDNSDCESELSAVTYGTTSFHVVWESMVDRVYGTIEESEKKYFQPGSHWAFVDDSSKARNNAVLRPDTIMLTGEGPDKKCYILDSKYYSYDVLRKKNAENESEDDEDNGQETVSAHGSIPGTDSIQKQITYAEYIDLAKITYAEYIDLAKTSAQNQKQAKFKFESGKIFNAFILPGKVNENDGIRYIGYAEADWDFKAHEGYRRIYGVLLDTKTLMLNHKQKDSEAIKILADVIEHSQDSKI